MSNMEESLIHHEHIEYVVEYYWKIDGLFDNTDRYDTFDKAIERIRQVRNKGGNIISFYKNEKTVYDISKIE